MKTVTAYGRGFSVELEVNDNVTVSGAFKSARAALNRIESETQFLSVNGLNCQLSMGIKLPESVWVVSFTHLNATGEGCCQ